LDIFCEATRGTTFAARKVFFEVLENHEMVLLD